MNMRNLSDLWYFLYTHFSVFIVLKFLIYVLFPFPPPPNSCGRVRGLNPLNVAYGCPQGPNRVKFSLAKQDDGHLNSSLKSSLGFPLVVSKSLSTGKKVTSDHSATSVVQNWRLVQVKPQASSCSILARCLLEKLLLILARYSKILILEFARYSVIW